MSGEALPPSSLPVVRLSLTDIAEVFGAIVADGMGGIGGQLNSVLVTGGVEVGESPRRSR